MQEWNISVVQCELWYHWLRPLPSSALSPHRYNPAASGRRDFRCGLQLCIHRRVLFPGGVGCTAGERQVQRCLKSSTPSSAPTGGCVYTDVVAAGIFIFFGGEGFVLKDDNFSWFFFPCCSSLLAGSTSYSWTIPKKNMVLSRTWRWTWSPQSPGFLAAPYLFLLWI